MFAEHRHTSQHASLSLFLALMVLCLPFMTMEGCLVALGAETKASLSQSDITQRNQDTLSPWNEAAEALLPQTAPKQLSVAPAWSVLLLPVAQLFALATLPAIILHPTLQIPPTAFRGMLPWAIAPPFFTSFALSLPFSHATA